MKHKRIGRKLLRSERGTLELLQQSLIGFFIVFMGLGGVFAFIHDIDQRAEEGSGWLEKQNPTCAGDDCTDFAIGNGSNRLNPYQ